jgi:phosphate butyryltransferase
VEIEMIRFFKDILDAAKGEKARRLLTLAGEPDLDIICRAAAAGFIIPWLVGDGKAIEKMIDKTPLASLEHEIVDEKDPSRALYRAISMIREGRADMLGQGNVDQNTFLNAVLDAKAGLLKSKLASYVSIFQMPKHDKLILVTDTFLNNYPTITEKQFILENALRLSGVLGIDAPKVAALAAIEQVNPGIPSTLDAAILSKMSERKQFGRAIVEGPLDIDCSLSHVAAERKGIRSVVTGNVDIYLVPEIDTGHLLAESLVFFGRMPTAGMVMGMTAPVILDVPFVSNECRVVEIALASLVAGQGGNGG